jgi:hypothetical protein
MTYLKILDMTLLLLGVKTSLSHAVIYCSCELLSIGGTAGLVVTYHPAENPNWKVLVVEAGPLYVSFPFCHSWVVTKFIVQ